MISIKKTKALLKSDRGEATLFTCFLVTGIIMLVSFLLLYASVRINCINIRNGAKMELNNLTASIYSDTYRSQRESNFGEYLKALYQSSDYQRQLEASVEEGLAQKIALSTDDYQIKNIRLTFDVKGDRIEYVFSCDAEFYIYMFGGNYPVITEEIRLTGYHNIKF